MGTLRSCKKSGRASCDVYKQTHLGDGMLIEDQLVGYCAY
jgi:hypothetical protein